MRKLIMIICVIVFTLSVFQILSYMINTVKTRDIYEGIADIYYKNINNDVEDYLGEIKDINPDINGWITIPNTKIDYPIVKGNDNEYYLSHDINGNENRHGAIFMDYRNDITRHKNICLYGHHMKDGTMFRDLVKFKRKEFFDDNRLIYLDINGNRQKYQIFSVYIIETNSPNIKLSFKDVEEYKDYFYTVKEKSLFPSEIDFLENRTMLTLSTCTYEYKDARLVIHALSLEG